MQSLYEFLILNEFNILKTSLDSRFKHIFLIAKSFLPPIVRTIDLTVSWESFLNMRKNFVTRFNQCIAEYFCDKEWYFLSIKETCLWRELYSNLGVNFMNYLFNECKLFLEWHEDRFINISLKAYLPSKRNWPVVEKRDVKRRFSYDHHINISRRKMLYNNIIKDGEKLLIQKKNILEDVLKQDVGRDIEFKLKRTSSIAKLEQVGKMGMTVRQIRKLLKNYLPQKEIVVPKEMVLSFLQYILTKIIHHRIFNKRVHFDRFLKNISLIVKRDLSHTITLGELLDGMIEGNNLVFHNLCAKTVLWLVNETKELDFIPISQWIYLEKQALEELISKGHLQKAYLMTNVIAKAKFDHNVVSIIRFIPKDNCSKFRPIIYKSMFQKNTEKFAKICNIFLKQLLATEKKTATSITTNIQRYWSNFVNKIDKKDRVYYVKTDIKDAFGSILHEVLKDILIKLFDKIKTPYLTLAQFECAGIGRNRVTICDQFSELQLSFPTMIARETTISKKVSLVKLKNYILYYINNSYVKLKNFQQAYHYVKGLPQGIKLSSALCDLYYNDFDTKYVKDLFNPEEGDILLRLVDDYLFITKNRDKAAAFLHRITNFTSKYGFEIQQEKTISNLFNEQLLSRNEIVPYFGYLFDLQKKTISLDLSVYEGKQFKSTISFRTAIDLKSFKRRILNLSAVRVNNILFDVSILNKKTLLINLYKTACLLALRFDAIYSELSKEEANFKIVFAVLKKAISTLVIKISCKNRFLLRKGNGNLRGVLAYYLILNTFIIILRIKNCYQTYLTKLHAMLISLRKNMTSSECKLIKRITKRLPLSVL
ncbi:telomerase reverse transcriptase-like isoform X3 [Rhodnius prolixus]